MRDAMFIQMKKAEHWQAAKCALRTMVDMEGHKRLCEPSEDSQWRRLSDWVETFIRDTEQEGLQE